MKAARLTWEVRRQECKVSQDKCTQMRQVLLEMVYTESASSVKERVALVEGIGKAISELEKANRECLNVDRFENSPELARLFDSMTPVLPLGDVGFKSVFDGHMELIKDLRKRLIKPAWSVLSKDYKVDQVKFDALLKFLRQDLKREDMAEFYQEVLKSIASNK